MIDASEDVPRFERRFFDPQRRISRIGDGPLGGKARGLVTAARVVAARRAEIEAPGLTLDVPALAVVSAEVFDDFLERNRLRGLLADDPPQPVVSDAFRNATLPAEWLGDLRALAQDARIPLACRSSSVLEDALGRPFAGVYGTKMIPGNQGDADARFRALADAVRFAFASAFSPSARAYQRAAGILPEPERMAIVVQEVVGVRHADRFYPTSPASRAPTASTRSVPRGPRRASSIWPWASARRSWTEDSAGPSRPPTRGSARPSPRRATASRRRSPSSGR